MGFGGGGCGGNERSFGRRSSMFASDSGVVRKLVLPGRLNCLSK